MHIEPRRKGLLPGLAGVLIVIGVLLIALPFVTQALSRHTGSPAKTTVATRQSSIREATSSLVATDATVAAAAAAQFASTSALATATSEGDAAGGAAIVLPDVPRVAQPAGPSPDAYQGLGCWVDIYDTRAWNNPSAAVADMARHGVRTLYIETSNSRSSFTIKDPLVLASFIREAHAHDLRIVAWYLPDMTQVPTDYDRIAQAIAFKTADGQKFDSFALDIESSAVKSESARSTALGSLSSMIRTLVGASYPLGAIIPSPTGIAEGSGYWDTFPYAMVAQTYNVFVPMSYYTYHGSGSSAAYADTLSNVRILRAQKGCAKTPIHLIGGLAENSSTAELQSFVRAAKETGCIGASLYEWAGTTSADWKELAALKQ